MAILDLGKHLRSRVSIRVARDRVMQDSERGWEWRPLF